MNEGIRIEKIKQALKTNEKLTDGEKNRFFFFGRKKGAGYGIKEEQWGMYDSITESYGEAFYDVLPKEGVEFESKARENHFREYIEKVMQKSPNKDRLSAVEFGGPGSNLFAGFKPGLFKKDVGVCLRDIRSKDQKLIDKDRNHSVIVGNILEVTNDDLLKKVTETLGADKTDLIICRMEGPLKQIDKNPAILDRVVRNWYKMLNENGLMFIQFESKRRDDKKTETETQIGKWVEIIKEKFPEIDIQMGFETIRLHKKIGSPAELPPTTQLFKS